VEILSVSGLWHAVVSPKAFSAMEARDVTFAPMDDILIMKQAGLKESCLVSINGDACHQP